jgi:hypothetical protein
MFTPLPVSGIIQGIAEYLLPMGSSVYMLKELPRDVPEMDLLDYTTLMTISEMAAGMSKAEILETFSIDPEDFSKTEQIAFDEFYAYGRGMAVHTVVRNLMDQSRGRTGTVAAMSFLRRFAKEFEADLEDSDTSGSFSFQFGSSKDT